jgi:hypothetical protein
MKMNYTELKKVLDPEFKGITKGDFIAICQLGDQRERVGGPKGKGRVTKKRALQLLGVR